MASWPPGERRQAQPSACGAAVAPQLQLWSCSCGAVWSCSCGAAAVWSCSCVELLWTPRIIAAHTAAASRRMWTLLPLLLLAPPTRSTAVATGNHVQYLSFYDYNATEQHTICTVGLYTCLKGNTLLANSSLLAAWQHYRFPSVLDVEDLGGGFNDGLYSRGGYNRTHLNPQWKTLIDGLLASASPYIGRRKAIRGVFLGDEPCCSGLPVSELDELASYVKSKLVGTGAFIYVNECSAPFVGLAPGHGGCPAGGPFCPYSGLMGAKIPSSLDFISVDLYTGNGSEAAVVRRFYETSVYPKLAAHQSTWVVPGTFADGHLGRAMSSSIMLEKINGYWTWAQNDTRVVGINPWHWARWGSMANPGTISFGAQEFPAVRSRLKEIGMVIRKSQRDADGGYGGLGRRPLPSL